MLHLRTGCAGLLALSLCTAAMAAPATLSISLERDCNGCTSGTRLTLCADGRARLDTLGKERLGTASESRAGRLRNGDFAALARLAQASGFNDLGDDLSDPSVQDGPWLRLRIDSAGGQAKEVFFRGDAKPAALARLLDALDTATGDIAFDRIPLSEGDACRFSTTPR